MRIQDIPDLFWFNHHYTCCICVLFKAMLMPLYICEISILCSDLQRVLFLGRANKISIQETQAKLGIITSTLAHDSQIPTRLEKIRIRKVVLRKRKEGPWGGKDLFCQWNAYSMACKDVGKCWGIDECKPKCWGIDKCKPIISMGVEAEEAPSTKKKLP